MSGSTRLGMFLQGNRFQRTLVNNVVTNGRVCRRAAKIPALGRVASPACADRGGDGGGRNSLRAGGCAGGCARRYAGPARVAAGAGFRGAVHVGSARRRQILARLLPTVGPVIAERAMIAEPPCRPGRQRRLSRGGPWPRPCGRCRASRTSPRRSRQLLLTHAPKPPGFCSTSAIEQLAGQGRPHPSDGPHA